jgi:hypothetical protein
MSRRRKRKRQDEKRQGRHDNGGEENEEGGKASNRLPGRCTHTRGRGKRNAGDTAVATILHRVGFVITALLLGNARNSAVSRIGKVS